MPSHIIQKLKIKVTTEDQREGHLLQEHLLNIVKNQLITAIDEELTALDDPTKILKINTLRLQLGEIAAKDLKDKIRELVRQAIGRAWEEKIAETIRNEPEKEPEIKSVRVGERLLEVLTYFLEKGSLPWWGESLVNSISELEYNLVKILEQKTESLSGLWTLLEQNEVCRVRFAAQFSKTVFYPLLFNVFPQYQVEITELQSIGKEVLKEYSIGKSGDVALKRSLLESLIETQVRAMPAIRQRFVAHLSKSIVKFVQKNNQGTEKEKIEPIIKKEGLFTDLTEEIRKEIARQKPKSPLPTKYPKEELNTQEIPNSNLSPELIAALFGTEEKETKKDYLKSPQIPDQVYLQNAGLILLHAMLPPFLMNLGLAQYHGFPDESAKNKSIYLLHYLVTKEENPSEDLLFLPKLLCDWPLEKPVLFAPQIDKATKEECEELLKSALEHWSILPNSSPDALRSSFLQRPGKLERTGPNTWKLSIEPAALDLLLRYLPWGMSVTKYAWMSQSIVIDWEAVN